MKSRGYALQGQVTVYAALSLSLVISLVCVCIQSVQVSLIYSELDMAARLSIESVFAGYMNDMLKEFDVMVLGEEQGCDEKLQYYVKFNTENICGKENIKYINAQISGRSYMTDYGGDALKQQALEYMKYAEASNIAASIMNIEKETKKSQCINEVVQDIQDVEEQLVYMDEITLELISLVEGIKTDKNGIIIRDGKPVISGEYFAKSLIMGPLSPQTAAVDHEAVYKSVSGMGSLYTDVSQIIEDMRDNISLFEETGEGAVQNAYKNNLEKLKDTVTSVLKKTEEALSLIELYENKRDERSDGIDECILKLISNRELLGDELCDTMVSDFKGMNREANRDEMCNISFMRTGLENNYRILSNANRLLECLDISLAESKSGDNEENIRTFEESLRGISNTLLKFNYNGIDFEASENKLEQIKKLKNLLTQGISEIVLEGIDVSDRQFEYQGLAENFISEGISDISKTSDKDNESDSYKQNYTQNANDMFMYCEYIIEHFPCFMDKNEWSSIFYPLEYIIAGSHSDRENINSIVIKLSFIREGINMSHLLLDSKKRSEAFALASSLVGFTGNAAVIKAAQYLIMGVWAYGESLMDVRRLYNGEELPIIKTASDWKVSLDNLFAMNFDDDGFEGMDAENVKDRGRLQRFSEGKMNYLDYLEMLLMSVGDKEKNYRAMTAMELKMISMGHSDFRMNSQIYEAVGTVTVELKKKNHIASRVYEKRVNYGYI